MDTIHSAPPLQITVLGAGIAGLTFALAALQNGHNVTLLEKSRFLRETGAALHVGSNASGLLRRLGIDLPSIGANLCEGFVSIDGKTAEVVKDLEFDKSQFEEPWYLVHRVDLHEELKRKVVEEGGILELGVKVVEVDAARAVVRLEDGRVFEGDVVIGADGNRSFARKCIDPTMDLKPWGQSCYRWLVSRDKLLEDPELKGLVAKPGYYEDIVAPDRKIIMYPCRGNTEYNLAGFVPSEEAARGDDWEQAGNKFKMVKSFGGFHSQLSKLASTADKDLKVWQLMDMEQLDKFNTGRLALIGDAAHPFLPYLGQGAAQAMEDAVAAATSLGRGTSPSEIPELLGLYDNIRRERVHYVQSQTRRNGMSGQEQLPPNFTLQMARYCFNYDVWDDTAMRLKQWRQKSSRKDESGGDVGEITRAYELRSTRSLWKIIAHCVGSIRLCIAWAFRICSRRSPRCS